MPGEGPNHGSYRPLVDLDGKGVVFKWATKLLTESRNSRSERDFETMYSNILIYRWDNDKRPRGRVTCLRSYQEQMLAPGQTPVPNAHAHPRSVSLTWNTDASIVCGHCSHVPKLSAQLSMLSTSSTPANSAQD